MKLWSRSGSRVCGRSMFVLPPPCAVLLTLLSERRSPRTSAPPSLPHRLFPAGWLVQGQKLGPVQDIVAVSGPELGLAAGHGGGAAVEDVLGRI